MDVCVSEGGNNVRVQNKSPVSGHSSKEEGSDCREHRKKVDIGGEGVEKVV